MASPDDRRYTESHEWHKPQHNGVTLGLTRYAVDALTDVTYVELPDAGTELAAGDSIGEVESVKTTSDIYSAVGGKVTEVNQKALDDPSLLNSDPFGDGWLIRIETTDLSPLDDLMDAGTYDEKYPAK